jgi:hypothetical protein
MKVSLWSDCVTVCDVGLCNWDIVCIIAWFCYGPFEIN